MNYKTLNLIILLSILFLFSCSDSINDNNTNNTYEFGTEITIQFGETINVGDEELQFSFDSFFESRCPSDVICAWEGVGEATLSQIITGQTEEFSLSIRGLCQEDCGEDKDIGGYNIKLLELNPYPSYANPVTEEDYSAIITVTEI